MTNPRISKPDPKDYPDRVNQFVRDMMEWRGSQVPRFPSIPPDLECLFTPESLEEVKKRMRRMTNLSSPPE